MLVNMPTIKTNSKHAKPSHAKSVPNTPLSEDAEWITQSPRAHTRSCVYAEWASSHRGPHLHHPPLAERKSLYRLYQLDIHLQIWIHDL